MQKNCILLFLLIVSVTINAQTKLIEYSLSSKESVESVFHVTFENDDACFTTIAYKGGATKLLLQQGNLQHLQQDKLSNKADLNRGNYLLSSDHENYYLKDLNGIFQNNTLLECCYSEPQKCFYFVQTDISTGISHTTDTLLLEFNEYFVTLIKDDNTIYVLTYNDRSDKLNFYSKKISLPLIWNQKIIDLQKIFPDKKQQPGLKHFSSFFGTETDDGYYVFDNTHPNPLWTSVTPQKIYHSPGKLIFTLEEADLNTYLLQFSLKDFSFGSQLFSVPAAAANGKTKMKGFSNSYLADSMLIKTGTCNHSFFFSAVNINTGKQNYSTVAMAKDADSNINSAIFNSGSITVNKKQQKEGVFKIFSSDRMSIAMNRINDSLWDIQLGSPAFVGVSFGAVMVSLAMSAALTYGINSIPNMNGFFLAVPSAYGDSKKFEKNIISLKNTINLKTFTFDSSAINPENNLWNKRMESALSFIKKNRANFKDINPYIFNKNIYLSYIDKKENKYFVYRF